MRILFIGGTGMTGPYAVNMLAKMGHEVHLFNRQRSGSPLIEGAVRWLGDKSELPAWRQRWADLRFDVVAHMMALNAEDASQLLASISGIIPRIVAISSCDVYRAYGCLHRGEEHAPASMPLDEGSPLRARLHLHGQHYEKINVESALSADLAVSLTILRYPAVYGPGDSQHRMRDWVRRMDDHRPYILMGEAASSWRFSHSYVENVAGALVCTITNAAASGETFNVAEQEPPTVIERALRLQKHLGWNGQIRTLHQGCLPGHIPDNLDFRHHIVVDSTRIRTRLGYSEHIAPEECLARTIAWERQHPVDLARIDSEYAAEDAYLANGPTISGSRPLL